MFKTATVIGLVILSMNPDSEVDQMPSRRQSQNIANANAFLSNFQRTTSRTLKFFALDNLNLFFSAIFESLILRSANFLCTVKQCGRLFASLFSVFRGKIYKVNFDFFPSIQIFKAYFKANRGSKRRRTENYYFFSNRIVDAVFFLSPSWFFYDYLTTISGDKYNMVLVFPCCV